MSNTFQIEIIVSNKELMDDFIAAKQHIKSLLATLQDERDRNLELERQVEEAAYQVPPVSEYSRLIEANRELESVVAQATERNADMYASLVEAQEEARDLSLRVTDQAIRFAELEKEYNALRKANQELGFERDSTVSQLMYQNAELSLRVKALELGRELAQKNAESPKVFNVEDTARSL